MKIIITLIALMLTLSSSENLFKYCKYTFDNGLTYDISKSYSFKNDYCSTIGQETICMNPCQPSLTCEQQNITTLLCIIQNNTYSGCGKIQNVEIYEDGSGGINQLVSSVNCTTIFSYPCRNTFSTEKSNYIESVSKYVKKEDILYNITFLSPNNCPITSEQLSNSKGMKGTITILNFSFLGLTLNDWVIELAINLQIDPNLIVILKRTEQQQQQQSRSIPQQSTETTLTYLETYFHDSENMDSIEIWNHLESFIMEENHQTTVILGIINAEYENNTSNDDGDDNNDNKLSNTWVIVIIVSGVVFGLIVLFCIYYLYKRSRHSSKNNNNNNNNFSYSLFPVTSISSSTSGTPSSNEEFQSLERQLYDERERRKETHRYNQVNSHPNSSLRQLLYSSSQQEEYPDTNHNTNQHYDGL